MSRFCTKLNRDWYRMRGKRLLDIAGSGFLLLLFSPFIALLGLMVRLAAGPPVLFVQARPGLNEQCFRMFKFRTMTNARSAGGEYLPDRLRMTWIGNLLRTTSLDELPELWNVLKGEMSLVGPRPLLVDYLPYYTPEEHRRHTIRPGMTGLAQTQGRNQTTWAERLAWDIQYVEHCSFRLDCRILARTIRVILRSDGGIAAVDALGRFDRYRTSATPEPLKPAAGAGHE